MSRIKSFLKSITPFEYCLWAVCALAIVLSFLLCGNKSYLNLTGALIGVTALIFIAKGNVIGNFLGVAFAVFYGVISYFPRYYGEMITYLGMSAPAAIVSIVAWLKHPFQGKKTEVKINRLAGKEYLFAMLLSVGVTVAFYFILRALNTANLIWSTASVLTSFYASYLNIRRSPFYAIAYCANDVVLIVLWAILSVQNPAYVCMVICFAAFLLNDIYGFVSWTRLQKKQRKAEENPEQTE
ncbi:MAG: nicotinamide riboside transporter PnuC [Clostridia bacterium]|nr:nicotinamide riboside transporter PnuC [Clostridia bacterium]